MLQRRTLRNLAVWPRCRSGAMRAFPKNLNPLAPVAQSVGHTLVQVPDAALCNMILLCNEVALPEFFTAASARPPAVVSAATESMPRPKCLELPRRAKCV